MGSEMCIRDRLWAWEHERQEPPHDGSREVIIDWSGRLLTVIENTEVHIASFLEVDESFARDEGEGDLSLAYWRRVHWDYFSAECQLIGKVAARDMPIVCQRFRCVLP